MKHSGVVTRDFLKSLFHELMWKRACDTASRWWSARVILFTINCLIFTSGVCICIILQFSVADPQPASQHPDLTVFLAFSLFLMQKAVGFWGLSESR